MAAESRQARRRRIRRRIVRAAARVFADAGFAGARMDEIARRAQVNKSTLYYQVGDKAALYAAVLEQIVGPAAGDVGDVDKGRPVEPQLRAMVTEMARAAGSNPHAPAIFLREIADGGANLTPAARQGMIAGVQRLRQILRVGARQGVFRPVNPVVTYFTILGGLLGYITAGPIRRAMISDAGVGAQLGMIRSVDEVGKRIADLVVGGIRR